MTTNYDDMSDFEVNSKISSIVHTNCFHLGGNGNGVFVSKSTDRYDLVNIKNSNFDPCNNPSDAWPIIVNNKISIDFWGELWGADIQCDYEIAFEHEDRNPLRAAMICLLKSKGFENG